MEQRVFMKHKNKLTEGTSEKVNRALFKNKTNVILQIILLFKSYDSAHNEHFCSLKQIFLL
jgi:hypothetical protein